MVTKLKYAVHHLLDCLHKGYGRLTHSILSLIFILLAVSAWVLSALLACFGPFATGGGVALSSRVRQSSQALLLFLWPRSTPRRATSARGARRSSSPTMRLGLLVPRRCAWESRRATEAVLPWPPSSVLRASGRLHLGVPFLLVTSSFLRICRVHQCLCPPCAVQVSLAL